MNSCCKGSPNSRRWCLLFVESLIWVSYLVFFITGHIQEDQFIKIYTLTTYYVWFAVLAAIQLAFTVVYYFKTRKLVAYFQLEGVDDLEGSNMRNIPLLEHNNREQQHLNNGNINRGTNLILFPVRAIITNGDAIISLFKILYTLLL